jgi:hypothetical protein
MTTLMSDGSKQPLEVVFKGAGIIAEAEVPEDSTTTVQWAVKGSYRSETIFQYINALPQRAIGDYCIQCLDDYSVHVMPEVTAAFLERGYILVIWGGGITGDIQVNDTHLHRELKRRYRLLEAELILSQMHANVAVPEVSRNDQLAMIDLAWQQVHLSLNYSEIFQSLFMTNAFDGSRDNLVSPKIFNLVGKEIQAFRKKLKNDPVPSTVEQLLQTIVRPEGVVCRPLDSSAVDEGTELLNLFSDEDPGSEFEQHSDSVSSSTASDGHDSRNDDITDDDQATIPECETPQPNGISTDDPSQQLLHHTSPVFFPSVGDESTEEAGPLNEAEPQLEGEIFTFDLIKLNLQYL